MKLANSFAVVAVISLTKAFAAEDDQAFLARLVATFEPGGCLESSQFLSTEMRSGPLHQVSPLTYNDGLNNTYLLSTNGSEIEVTGGIALRTDIREIYAIEALRNMNKGDEFRKALAASGKSKIDGVAQLVRDPANSLAAIPKGASRFFGRVGESLKGGKSEGEGSGLESLTGVSKAKAKLAAELGVSPYTLNPDLQRELTATARAMAGGGLVMSAATAAVGGAAGDVLSVLGVNQTVQQTLVNNTPADLRILNRKKLFALGVDRTAADEFLMHPWFSPVHATIVTEALNTIGVDPIAFLRRASQALTPEDALYFQRIAQVLARYHQTKSPLRSIRMEGGVVCAVDGEGTLVVPLSCDYAIWAERCARRAEEFVAMTAANPEIKGLALWIDGAASERLRDEFGKRNIALSTNVLGER